MCDVKKYNKEVFKVGDIVNVVCPMCEGRGGWVEWRNFGDDEKTDSQNVDVECDMCNGEGHLEKELRECPHCRELVSENDLTWVYDRYGIPYKKVCWDCYEEVDEEIGNWEYDYLGAGEYHNEDY